MIMNKNDPIHPLISKEEREDCIKWLTQRVRGSWIIEREESIYQKAKNRLEYRNGLLGLVNVKCKKITADEIRAAFDPVFEALWDSVPDSLPFRHPVDPVKDFAEDYYSVIKSPMDISTARNKIYSSGWELIETVDLIFSNARTYNGPKNNITRAAQRLSGKFYQEADAAMRSLGYCCARNYQFNLRVLYCCTPQSCQIGGDADYFVSGEHVCCVKCYNAAGESITVDNVELPKSDFVAAKNNTRDPEPWIECSECGRRVHQVCVLYHEELYPNDYTCNSEPVKFSARNLPQSKLGSYIEDRINTFLRSESSGIDCGTICVRLVSNKVRKCDIKPRMKAMLDCELPYRAKTVFIFQIRDGAEICFFAFHTQEYDCNCPEPNKRRVYLSYLDSINIFYPKFLRSRVYHEILISYMDYVRKLGYAWVHIWACPPGDRDDYIFYCHPFDQKTPTAKRLIEWYKVMLNNAINQKAIRSYQDLYSCAQENGITSPTQIPYMDGDFWSLRLEEDVTHDDLMGTLERHRNGFFVIELHSSRLNCHLTAINDQDPVLLCQLVDSRESFLTFCRERNYEFSTPRRTKYSTLAFVIELHKRFFNYNCSSCHTHITHTRYHCARCLDFNLCHSCHENVIHPHPLNETFPNAPSLVKMDFDDFKNNVAHTLFCHEATCTRNLCILYRDSLPHYMNNMCKNRAICRYCKTIVRIYDTHLQDCHNQHCGAKLCSMFKRRSRDIQDRNKMREIAHLNRRVQNMSNAVPRGISFSVQQRQSVRTSQPTSQIVIPPSKRVPRPNVSPPQTSSSATRDFSISARYPNVDFRDLSDLERHLNTPMSEAEREWVERQIPRFYQD